MRVFYGVYLQDDKSPMALFVREDWAIDFQRRMNKKNPAVTLYVRPTQRALDLPSALPGCDCFVTIESYNKCPVHGTANQ